MKATLIPELCAGTELEIVNAARRSFDNHSGSMTEKDERLVRFLWREKHLLPFRHPQLSFSCEAPVFIARQLGKHQTGLSWSETSRRYQTGRMQFWTPDEVREAPENAKQGTGPAMKGDVGTIDIQTFLRHKIGAHNDLCLSTYNDLLDRGVAPEQARAVLPQSMYVYWTWTGSLLAWLHLIRERSHPNAQKETRDWVHEHIVPAIRERFPITSESLLGDLQ